jgi:hypothetical protein
MSAIKLDEAYVLQEHHPEDSPSQKLKCHCGSTTQTSYNDRINCAICGAFIYNQGDSPVYVRFKKANNFRL